MAGTFQALRYHVNVNVLLLTRNRISISNKGIFLREGRERLSLEARRSEPGVYPLYVKRMVYTCASAQTVLKECANGSYHYQIHGTCNPSAQKMCVKNGNVCIHTSIGDRQPTEFGPKTVGDICNKWTRILTKSGVPEPRASVEYFVAFILGKKTIYNVARTRKLTTHQVQQIDEMCQRRLQHVPVQYIIGEWDFRDLVLKLRPPVFIPSPETEELVELAAGSIKDRNFQAGRFLEVGCGSGAITLSLLNKFPQLTAVCLDISSDACCLTKENAERLNLADRLQVYQVDVSVDKDVTELKQCDRFDFVISNPPYISTKDIPTLEKQIREYEDLRSVDGGSDGLRIVKSILNFCSTVLQPMGELWLEVDVHHPLLIQQHLEEKSDLDLIYGATYQDYLGRDRFCLVRKAILQGKSHTL